MTRYCILPDPGGQAFSNSQLIILTPRSSTAPRRITQPPPNDISIRLLGRFVQSRILEASPTTVLIAHERRMRSHDAMRDEEAIDAAWEASKGATYGALKWGALTGVLGGIGYYASPVYRSLTIQFKV